MKGHAAARCSRCNVVLRLLAIWAAGLGSAVGGEYPERVIHAVVPFATGGTNDLTARLVAPYLSKALGQPVVVENRPGAAGNIGIEAVAKSQPDGYTLLFSATASTQNPALFKTLRYDPLNDIQPVAPIASSPYALVTNSHLPVRSVQEFIKLARSRPGALNASSGGIGTRLSVELFKMQNNLRLEIIPYNGTGASALAVATGEADFAITDTSGFMAYIPTGRVRVLAIAGDRRLPSFPEVPTMAEAGLPNFKAGAVAAVYVTAKTPAAIVQKLNTAINNVIATPEVRQALNRQGAHPAPMTVDQFNQWYRREIQLWKDIVTRAKIPLADE